MLPHRGEVTDLSIAERADSRRSPHASLVGFATCNPFALRPLLTELIPEDPDESRIVEGATFVGNRRQPIEPSDFCPQLGRA
jgi:hypothetical protein